MLTSKGENPRWRRERFSADGNRLPASNLPSWPVGAVGRLGARPALVPDLRGNPVSGDSPRRSSTRPDTWLAGAPRQLTSVKNSDHPPRLVILTAKQRNRPSGSAA